MRYETIKLIGYISGSESSVFDELKFAVSASDKEKYTLMCDELVKRIFHPNGEANQSYQFVCAVNAEGRVVMTPDTMGQFMELEPLFVIGISGGDLKCKPYTVIGLRRFTYESIHGSIHAKNAEDATNLAIRFMHNTLGEANDWSYIVTILGNEIVMTVENWSEDEKSHPSTFSNIGNRLFASGNR